MLYRLILKLRKGKYDSGKGVTTLPQSVVCVGNVTVGGTGKTPHTELILRLLGEGRNIAVLSRGYKRKSKGMQIVSVDSSAAVVGDEPLQIKRKFPNVSVVVDKDRVHAASCVPADIYVLDDGFQYRKLKPSLSIVLADYNRPVWKDSLLPFGELRDLPERLDDADIIIVTKCPDNLSDAQMQALTSRYATASQKVFFTRIAYSAPLPVFPEADSSLLEASEAVLFSGIAKDAPLVRHLESRYNVRSRIAFPDHHAFSRPDVRRIERMAAQYPGAAVFTTEKDAQRIADVDIPNSLRARLFYVPIEAEFFSGESRSAFMDCLSATLS